MKTLKLLLDHDLFDYKYNSLTLSSRISSNHNSFVSYMVYEQTRFLLMYHQLSAVHSPGKINWSPSHPKSPNNLKSIELNCLVMFFFFLKVGPYGLCEEFLNQVKERAD